PMALEAFGGFAGAQAVARRAEVVEDLVGSGGVPPAGRGGRVYVFSLAGADIVATAGARPCHQGPNGGTAPSPAPPRDTCSHKAGGTSSTGQGAPRAIRDATLPMSARRIAPYPWVATTTRSDRSAATNSSTPSAGASPQQISTRTGMSPASATCAT